MVSAGVHARTAGSPALAVSMSVAPAAVPTTSSETTTATSHFRRLRPGRDAGMGATGVVGTASNAGIGAGGTEGATGGTVAATGAAGGPAEAALAAGRLSGVGGAYSWVGSWSVIGLPPPSGVPSCPSRPGVPTGRRAAS